MRHQLYRYYDARGCLLYVGISFSAVARAAQHRGASSWYWRASTMTIDNCKTREDAEERERIAIMKEMPQHNVVWNYGGIGQPTKPTFQGGLHETLRLRNQREIEQIFQDMERRKDDVKRQALELESTLRAARAEHRAARERLRRMCNATEVLKGRAITVEHVLWQMINPSRPPAAPRSVISRVMAALRRVAESVGAPTAQRAGTRA